MIGILVTGHGTFASGMTSAVRLLAGKPEKYVYVDYLQEHSTDELEYNIREKLKELADCEGILIFADMTEAAPYKISSELSVKLKDTYRIRVIGGTNLGMLIQANMARGYVIDVDDLCSLALDEGRKHIAAYDEAEEARESGIR